jgi:hypothetical protein
MRTAACPPALQVGPNSRDQLFRFTRPDPPAALVHYYFGAQAGDYVAQMILGYRHLQVIARGLLGVES